MAKEKPQIRLPELPLFKRFSLVLRQEFATADEVLRLVEKTTNRINKLVQKAEDERRREEAAEAAEPVVEEMPEEVLEEEELEYEEDEAEEMEDEAEEMEDEAASEYAEDEAPGASEGEPAESSSVELPSGDEAQEDWRFPVEDDLPVDVTEDVTQGKPFWEDDYVETPSSRRTGRAKKRATRSKATTRKAAPEIVRVGARGKPVGKVGRSSVRAGRSKKSAKKPAAKKTRGKGAATRKR